jgi:hypothetical protein
MKTEEDWVQDDDGRKICVGFRYVDDPTPGVAQPMRWHRDDDTTSYISRFHTNEGGTWVERAWEDLGETFAELYAIVDNQLSFMRDKHLVQFTFEMRFWH